MSYEADGAGNSERLLNAVEKIMNNDGYTNVTIRKVCKEAGLAPGTFYRYFSGRTELMSARLDRDNAMRAKYLEERLRGFSSIQQVFIFSRYYAEMNYEAEPDFHLAMFTPGENWHRKRQPLTVLLEKVFSEGQRAGEINDYMKSDELAELFVDILRGCVHCWCVEKRSFDLKNRIEKVTRVFMHSFSLTL